MWKTETGWRWGNRIVTRARLIPTDDRTCRRLRARDAAVLSIAPTWVCTWLASYLPAVTAYSGPTPLDGWGLGGPSRYLNVCLSVNICALLYSHLRKDMETKKSIHLLHYTTFHPRQKPFLHRRKKNVLHDVTWFSGFTIRMQVGFWTCAHWQEGETRKARATQWQGGRGARAPISLMLFHS